MKQISTKICLFFFCALASLGIAQNIETNDKILTLQQAIEQALANYPALQIQQLSVERAQGQKTTAGLFPNPVITFYREDLKLNGANAGETTIYGGMPLNFLWTRWSGLSVASAQVDAEQLMLVNMRRLIKYKVQRAFAETHFADRNYMAWKKATEVFRLAAKASRARFLDGDMAGYEQQRITVEYLRYQKSETEAKVLLNNYQRQLAFLLNPDQSEALYKTSAIFPSQLQDISHEKLLALGMDNRPDLQAARATYRGKQAALTMNKWGRIPRITASAGYKKQVDNFKGLVLQLNFGIPLFNRNQGKIQSARAALSQQTLAENLLEKRVALEVRQAYDTFQLYRQQVGHFTSPDIQPPEQLLKIAQMSYSEGEMSLLELLDGVRAYSESFYAKNDLLLKYQLSIFELEKATAMSTSDF